MASRMQATFTERGVMRTHVATSADPIILHDADPAVPPKGHRKPPGFWYEVNGDWRRWARGESFTIGNYLHRLDLNDCNVLKIASLEALDAFHATYAVDSGRLRPQFIDLHIDWSRLVDEYDGVEIAPYQWQRRLDFDMGWYYSWDCASGCIWRPRGARLTYLRPCATGTLRGNLREPEQVLCAATDDALAHQVAALAESQMAQFRIQRRVVLARAPQGSQAI